MSLMDAQFLIFGQLKGVFEVGAEDAEEKSAKHGAPRSFHGFSMFMQRVRATTHSGWFCGATISERSWRLTRCSCLVSSFFSYLLSIFIYFFSFSFLFLFLTLGLNKALESQGARGLGKQASVLPGCMQEKSKVGRTDERNHGKTLRIKAGTL